MHREIPYLPWNTNPVIDCLANIHKKSRQEVENILLDNLNRIGINGKYRDQFYRLIPTFVYKNFINSVG